MFKILRVSIKAADSIATLTEQTAGREIPETIAARTDRENDFPPDMWKKLGEAG